MPEVALTGRIDAPVDEVFAGGYRIENAFRYAVASTASDGRSR